MSFCFAEGEREQNFSILEEVAAIRCTLEMTPGGDSSLDDELVVGLQVELQDEQDHELAAAIAQLTELVGAKLIELACIYWQEIS